MGNWNSGRVGLIGNRKFMTSSICVSLVPRIQGKFRNEADIQDHVTFLALLSAGGEFRCSVASYLG